MTTSLALDAESLYAELRRAVQPLMEPHTRLAGVISGGWWLAGRCMPIWAARASRARCLPPCTATISPAGA